MILGYDSNLGITPLYGQADYIPELVEFTSITFGGSSGMTISNIWGQSQVSSPDGWTSMTTAYLDDYNVRNAYWSEYTYLLSEFSANTFEAGILQGLGDISNWVLYRWDSESNQAVLLGDFDSDTTQYVDYTALLNNTYRYLLYAIGEEQMSPALVTDEVSLNYYGYFLIDVTNDVTYKFDTMLSGGELTQNMDYSSFQTNNKYYTYNVGDLQHMSGSVAALVRYANSQVYTNNTVGLLKNLRDCIQDNQRVKILKTRKGEGWYVFTYDYKDSVINQAIGAQPINASFSFSEIGDLYNGIVQPSLTAVY